MSQGIDKVVACNLFSPSSIFLLSQLPIFRARADWQRFLLERATYFAFVKRLRSVNVARVAVGDAIKINVARKRSLDATHGTTFPPPPGGYFAPISFRATP